MTLVLALRFHEGVVIASDGQATTDASGQPTRQPVRKLFATGRSIAWGAAGSVGLRQQLAGALSEREQELEASPDPRRLLVATVSAVQRAALADFVPLPGRRPPELCALFCWSPADPGTGSVSPPVILTVPATGAGHQLHGRWAAIGSGDVFAGYAMRAAAGLGAESLPAAAARVLAYGIVADAIETAAALLGPPIQLAEVTRAHGARVLDEDAIDRRLPGALAGWRARQRAALLDAA
jgi:ATP-dependent protease HslVU (ClpYQ) peptidase subunit